MEIQDIPFEVLTEIDLNDFEQDKMWHIERFTLPNTKLLFYCSHNTEPVLPYRYLGGFNLQAKVGDTCRLLLKTFVNYPDDDNKEIMYSGFYMWEGEVTERLLRESAIRIGLPVRKVLFEKVKKKPQEI